MPTGLTKFLTQNELLDLIRFISELGKPGDFAVRANATIQRFTALFGHPPTRPVPWANNEQSGATVAKRFRAVARHMATSNILFRCIDCTESTDLECPLNNPTIACPLNAQTLIPFSQNIIELCPRFWTQIPNWRAGIVLHEMLHHYFGLFFLHQGEPERRRDRPPTWFPMNAISVVVAGARPKRLKVPRRALSRRRLSERSSASDNSERYKRRMQCM